MNLIKYRVRDMSEEFACPFCGGPVYKDDNAIEDKDTERHFCSPSCARSWDRVERFCRQPSVKP